MLDSAAIDVRDLEKEYRDGYLFKKRFKALRGIDLNVKRGEVFGLLGPNGAGKTTLIKILLGIVRGTGGTARLLGESAGSKSARRKIGYLPENLNFPAHHTAIRALQLYGRLSHVPDSVIRSKSKELLQRVGLAGREKELVKKYSKGMRQRLGLAQALLHDPELLIMDEPTDGLDPVGRSEIRQLITDIRDQGKTVFLNSHILQEVELVCDRVAILAKGQLRGVGTPAELTNQFFAGQTSKVRIRLSGPEDRLASIAKERDADLMLLPDGSQQLSATANEQSDVDQIIDHLRSQEISIHMLERTSLTLEEVFLSAVRDDAPELPLASDGQNPYADSTQPPAAS